MAEGLYLEVVTGKGSVVGVEVEEVRLPGELGELGVLPGHTPLLTALGIGRLLYTIGGQERQMVITQGFAEVLPDRVTVLARAVRLPNEVDPEVEQRIFEEATTALKTANADDFAEITRRLRTAEACLEISA
ncbi:MAG: ATP synthase F1 subunit epsilon [Thermoanaerobaculales bacterium]|nr:ATP synthase F1 subunit epsilon [Thermoanaerobaculales bacterium]